MQYVYIYTLNIITKAMYSIMHAPESLHSDVLHTGPDGEEESGRDGQLLEESGGRDTRSSDHQQLVTQSTQSVEQWARE